MRHCVKLLALLPLLVTDIAFGQPGEELYQPEFEQGDSTVQLQAGGLKRRGQLRQREAALGLGYGVTGSWFTQLEAEYMRVGPAGTRRAAIASENLFQLTQPGKLPLDIGFLARLDWMRERSEGYHLRVGPLLQKDLGQIKLNGNLLFDRQIGADRSRPTEMGYQWQVKYRWKPQLGFGLQGFGEVGPWDDWAPRGEQLHLIGPMVAGKLSLWGKQELEYNAAYLSDRSERARSHGIRLQADYKF